MKQLSAVAASGIMLSLAACGAGSGNHNLTKSGLDPEKFKAEFKGDSTALFILSNEGGAEACITNFGGRLVSMMVPDKNGNFQDVVLGFDSVQAYFPENNLSDFGASIGRYANRINQGRFVIDGDTVQLPQNNFGHCLHGGGEMGDMGWQYRVYDAEQPNDSTLVLTIDSPDGDNGFPGTMTAQVVYTLHNNNALEIAYTATTDKPTIVNLTNHSYFNLSGDATHPITDNMLRIDAYGYTPIDSTYMTTGDIAPVDDTPFDFRKERAVGEYIKDFSNTQIKNGNGYDHNFVFNPDRDKAVAALELYSPTSGIVLEMYTDEPGVQVYSGNFLDGSVTGKKGVAYAQHTAICMESQHYPDSPNKPQWPSVRLNPGDTYTSNCIYKFSVK